MDLPQELLPFTLGEGSTPLIRSKTIGPGQGQGHLNFKLETANPFGSYKDRFAAFAIADMLGKNRQTLSGYYLLDIGPAIPPVGNTNRPWNEEKVVALLERIIDAAKVNEPNESK